MPFIVYGSITNYDPRPPTIIFTNISVSTTAGTYPIMTNAYDNYGTSTTSGTTYSVYAFTNTSAPYTVSYTVSTQTQIYVLAVGGGGGGSSATGGGGGGGGVVMNPVTLPTGSGTITIQVANGGIGGNSNTIGQGGTSVATKGNTTTVSFSVNSALNINAYGGGFGGDYYSANGKNGGPGGSGGGNGYTGTSGGNPTFRDNNYASPGGVVSGACGGGGGAGTGSTTDRSGGSGIQCFLPGIKDYNITSATYPSGIPVSGLYWGGGGGGSYDSNNTSSAVSPGGLGGGGGGSNVRITGSPTPVSPGGGSALNPGGYGTNNSVNGDTPGGGGSGGANTGGGSGGGWWSSAAANRGGSGIVIIAFPTSTVTSNTGSILTNSGLSASAYNSVFGAYGCKLLNYNYYGPIFTLRSSADTTGNNTKNFYADVCGNNIGDGYLGTGTSLSSWLTSAGGATTYAYVSKWYDQGMDNSFNCATQYTPGSQPAYELANKNINFGYASGVVTPSNTFFNIPAGTMPYNDSSYTYTIKHNNITANANISVIFESGDNSTNNKTSILFVNNQYGQYWYNNDYTGANKYAANNIITYKYTTGGGIGSKVNYINYATTSYSESNSTSIATRAQPLKVGYIGNTFDTNTASWKLFNGQLYYGYIFNTALSDIDRGIVEST